jgi:DNA-binding MarR family transcriptional regulator
VVIPSSEQKSAFVIIPPPICPSGQARIPVSQFILKLEIVRHIELLDMLNSPSHPFMKSMPPSLAQNALELHDYFDALAPLFLSGPPEKGGFEITLHEERALDTLGRKPSWTMSEFAAALRVTLPTATHTVDRLVKKRAVTRRKSGEDRRLVLISLSGNGLKRRQSLLEHRLSVCATLLKPLDSAERSAALQTMRRFAEAAQLELNIPAQGSNAASPSQE